MPHLDLDDLALIALGHCEPDKVGTQHLERCSECSNELRSLTRVVNVAADLSPDDQLVPPPASVWEGIQIGIANDETSSIAKPSTAKPKTAKPGSRSPWLPIGIAAGLAVLGGVGVGIGMVANESQAPQVVARASLAPLPDSPPGDVATGTATVARVGDHDELSVNTAKLADPTGFYEVWLIEPKNLELVSLGKVAAGESGVTLPIPADVSLTKFSVVDVSDEPDDGDPGHSSVSVLRGELSA